VEQFIERPYRPPNEPEVADAGYTQFSIVRVEKVYTGCPPETPYYALFSESIEPILAMSSVLEKSHKYVVPMPLVHENATQKVLSTGICDFSLRRMEYLTTEEKYFLNARISCCGASCYCLGEGRVMQDCGQGTCFSQAPCAEAQICRRNQCNYCAEEWYTSDWQIPCGN